jgi:hemerythrin
MNKITWNQDLSVGNALLDDQHKLFLGFINQLNEAIQIKESEKILSSLLESLVQYGHTHFRDEEIAIANRMDPEQLHQHQQEHDTYFQTIYTFQQAHKTGTANISNDLAKFLTTWLTTHIKHSDQQALT